MEVKKTTPNIQPIKAPQPKTNKTPSPRRVSGLAKTAVGALPFILVALHGADANAQDKGSLDHLDKNQKAALKRGNEILDKEIAKSDKKIAEAKKEIAEAKRGISEGKKGISEGEKLLTQAEEMRKEREFIEKFSSATGRLKGSVIAHTRKLKKAHGAKFTETPQFGRLSKVAEQHFRKLANTAIKTPTERDDVLVDGVHRVFTENGIKVPTLAELKVQSGREAAERAKETKTASADTSETKGVKVSKKEEAPAKKDGVALAMNKAPVTGPQLKDVNQTNAPRK